VATFFGPPVYTLRIGLPGPVTFTVIYVKLTVYRLLCRHSLLDTPISMNTLN